MERYPILALILRYGTVGAAGLGVLTALLAGFLAWAPLGGLGLVVGAVAGAVVFVLGKSYVEIVTIITEMLVPH